MIDIQDRVKEVRKHLNFSQSQLAKELGITREAYAQAELKRNSFQTDILSKIVINYNINGTWLLTGKGEMLETKKYGECEDLSNLNEPNASYLVKDQRILNPG